MIYAQSDSRFKVWNIEDKGNYSVVQFSTSRKDRKTDNYLNSRWSFVNFVGEAHEKIKNVKIGDCITNARMAFAWEPYEKDGEKIYPKSPRITVFDFETYGNRGRAKEKEPDEYSDSDDFGDDFPF